MSRLFVLVRPELTAGFHLAGVEAYGAEDAEGAQSMVVRWLDDEEVGLLALDEDFLEAFDVSVKKRLDSSETLYHLAIPGGRPVGSTVSRSARITRMVKRAIGVHITFGGGNGKGAGNER